MPDGLYDIDLSAIKEAMAACCGFSADDSGSESALTRLMDMSAQEVELVLDTAVSLRDEPGRGPREMSCVGQVVGILALDRQASACKSAQAAAARLGAYPLVLDGSDVLGEDGGMQDAVMFAEGLADCLVVCGLEQALVEEASEWASIPVINGGSDMFDPCQALADALTIRDAVGSLKGLSVTVAGCAEGGAAGNFMELAALCGMSVRVACPSGTFLLDEYSEECDEQAQTVGGSVALVEDLEQALAGANVVVVSPWAEEDDDEYAGWQIAFDSMSFAAKDALLLHPRPARRGVTASDEVLDSESCKMYEQWRNRTYVLEALLTMMMGAC